MELLNRLPYFLLPSLMEFPILWNFKNSIILLKYSKQQSYVWGMWAATRNIRDILLSNTPSSKFVVLQAPWYT